MINWDAALTARKLLKKESYEAMWTSGKTSNGNETLYGFGWNVAAINGHKHVGHGGAWQGFTSSIDRYPDEELSVIAFYNCTGATGERSGKSGLGVCQSGRGTGCAGVGGEENKVSTFGIQYDSFVASFLSGVRPMSNVDRRAFLGTTAFGTSLGFLSGLQPVSASAARIDSKLVTLDSGIEPLVKWLEETPREKLLEEAGSRIKKGLSYQELLTALFLAGVRNVQPRPTVGFKFHAVLMINSAHLASQAAADRERWLPILWAVDRFKDGQAATKKESGWRMKPVNELKLPTASKARAEFVAAMENWDEEAADTATAAMARTAGANELFDLYRPFRLPRFPRHRPQGDLRRQCLPHVAGDRLAACGTDSSLADLRRCCSTKATTPPSGRASRIGRAGMPSKS